jgi:ribosomal protein S27AE
MPTFMFFLHGQKVDEMKGADPTGLRQKTQQWALQSNQPVRLFERMCPFCGAAVIIPFPTDVAHLESQKSRIFYFT